MHAHTHTGSHSHRHTLTQTHKWTCACMHARAHSHTHNLYTHTCTHTHTHTHTHALTSKLKSTTAAWFVTISLAVKRVGIAGRFSAWWEKVSWQFVFRPGPDITVMVDWALKIDYLSNNGGYPGGDGKSSVCYLKKKKSLMTTHCFYFSAPQGDPSRILFFRGPMAISALFRASKEYNSFGIICMS